MRKDFIVDTTGESSEADFVERFWTENWQRTGGVETHASRFAGRLDRFSLKSEWRLMRKYLDRLPSPALLDGGCGTGEWTRRLTSLGYPTIGVDISRKTVDKLRELFPDGDFRVGDIRDTGLPDASVGGYFSWGTFEHFEAGLEPCIREAYRVLTPGGLLFVSVPFASLGLAFEEAWGAVPESPLSPQQRFYQWRLSRRDLAVELGAVGFEVLALRPIHRRQGVVRFLHNTFGLNYASMPVRALAFAIGAVMPRALCAHMLMAVARKPDSATDQGGAA